VGLEPTTSRFLGGKKPELNIFIIYEKLYPKSIFILKKNYTVDSSNLFFEILDKSSNSSFGSHKGFPVALSTRPAIMSSPADLISSCVLAFSLALRSALRILETLVLLLATFSAAFSNRATAFSARTSALKSCSSFGLLVLLAEKD